MNANLIDKIYECSFVPELWPDVLGEMAAIAGGQGGVLFAMRDKMLNWTASTELRPIFHAYVHDRWIARCTRRLCIFSQNHPKFMVEHDFWTTEEINNNPIYRDFFHPNGLGWSAGTGVKMPMGDNVCFSFEREHHKGPVERKLVDQLDELRPHIARAAFVSARLGLQRAKSASDTLALLGLPALVLDDEGVVVQANELMQAMSGQVQWRAFNHIALADKAANKLLWSALAALGNDGATNIRSFPLRGADARAEMIAHLVPIRRSAHDIFTTSSALLVVTPVTTPKAPDAELIRSLFDLTAAEARVARGLAIGETLDEIALTGAVALSTVRSQLRQVMQKTGCTRQSEVVGLLTNVALNRGDGE